MKIFNALLVLLIIGCNSNPVPVDKKPKHTIIHHESIDTTHTNETAIVAVIDTGLGHSSMTKNAKLCKYGHKNFTSEKETFISEGVIDPVPIDSWGHGTNVAGLIQNYADRSNFCMVILKVFSTRESNDNSADNIVKAIKYATNINANYINFSGGGVEINEEEKSAVKEFLDSGGTFVAAAGNERKDLDEQPYYPAMDDERVISVGSIEEDGSVSKYSNFGKKVKRWEYGTKRIGFGFSYTGTSQAAATVTGKIINESKYK